MVAIEEQRDDVADESSKSAAVTAEYRFNPSNKIYHLAVINDGPVHARDISVLVAYGGREPNHGEKIPELGPKATFPIQIKAYRGSPGPNHVTLEWSDGRSGRQSFRTSLSKPV